MKEQIVVSTPAQAINLKFDFHGVEVEINDFRKDLSLDGEDTIYLAMDADGQLSWFQYQPEPDFKHKEFESGTHPENALDKGTSWNFTQYLTGDLPVAWDESVIKYTIVEGSE